MEAPSHQGQIFLDKGRANSKDLPVLEVADLQKNFGGITALHRVSLSLNQGSILSIIGPNGAGKSTFINVTTGMFAPDGGKIHFGGKNIAGLPAHRIARLGISRTFQLLELFRGMTALENVMVGCHTRSRGGLLSSGLKLPSATSEERRIRREALEALERIHLGNKASQPVSALPLGERKMLDLA